MSSTSLRQQTNRVLACTAFTACAVVGATVGIAAARADAPVGDYTAAHAHNICAALDQDPSIAAGENVILDTIADGLEPDSAGQVLAIAILGWCPEHTDVLDAVIEKWSPPKAKPKGASA